MEVILENKYITIPELASLIKNQNQQFIDTLTICLN